MVPNEQSAEFADVRSERTDFLTVGQLGRVVSQHWILITVMAVLGAIGGFAAAKVLPPVYTATAIQLVKGVPGTGAAANYEAAQYAVSRAKSYPSFINSVQVLEGVRSDMKDQLTLLELRDQLSAANPVDTPLLQITAEAGTPEQARDLANSAARNMARFITQIETVAGKSPIGVETAVQASLPTEPTSPRPLLLTALGFAIGLTIGFGVALIWTQLRGRTTRAKGSRRKSRRTRGVPSWPSDDQSTPSSADDDEESAVLPTAHGAAASVVDDPDPIAGLPVEIGDHERGEPRTAAASANDRD